MHRQASLCFKMKHLENLLYIKYQNVRPRKTHKTISAGL